MNVPRSKTRKELYDLSVTVKTPKKQAMYVLMGIYDYDACLQSVINTIKSIVVGTALEHTGIFQQTLILNVSLSQHRYSENNSYLARKLWIKVKEQLPFIFPGITIIENVDMWNEITLDWS